MYNKKRMISNFFSLFIVQGANYLMPLITMPYLLRVLGPGYYGAISFAQALINYFIVITDYGFNLTATRRVSINRDNKLELSKIFTSIILIKITLALISFIILFVIVSNFGRFTENQLLYILTYGMVIGNVLTPIWLFQGLEKMKYITFTNLLSKIIILVLTFTIIKEPSDYIYVPLINSIGVIFVGLLIIIYAFKKFKMRFIFPGFRYLKEQIVDGWHVFLSQISVTLYTASNTFILGLFTNNIIVGYYSAAEKLIKAIRSLISPVSQVVYPYISKLVIESKIKAILFLRRIMRLIFLGTLVISIIVFLSAELLVNIVMGKEYIDSIVILKILSPLPFIGGIGNVCGQLTMLNFNLKKQYSIILVISGVINILLCLLLVPIFNEIGTALSVLVVELIVTLQMIVVLKRKKINLFHSLK